MNTNNNLEKKQQKQIYNSIINLIKLSQDTKRNYQDWNPSDEQKVIKFFAKNNGHHLLNDKIIRQQYKIQLNIPSSHGGYINEYWDNFFEVYKKNRGLLKSISLNGLRKTVQDTQDNSYDSDSGSDLPETPLNLQDIILPESSSMLLTGSFPTEAFNSLQPPDPAFLEALSYFL
jgi:hypothetical protein